MVVVNTPNVVKRLYEITILLFDSNQVLILDEARIYIVSTIFSFNDGSKKEHTEGLVLGPVANKESPHSVYVGRSHVRTRVSLNCIKD